MGALIAMRWRQFWSWWRNWFGEPKPTEVIFAILGAADAEIDNLPSFDPMGIEEYSLRAQNKIKQAKEILKKIEWWSENKNNAVNYLNKAINDLEIIKNKRNILEIVERKSADAHAKIRKTLDILLAAIAAREVTE